MKRLTTNSYSFFVIVVIGLLVAGADSLLTTKMVRNKFSKSKN